MSLFLLLSGCAPEGEIRQYTVDAETERIVTSDLLKSEFPMIPFEWEAPKSWQLVPNDQFSKVAWEVGAKPDTGRITVSDVSLDSGLIAQLSRWRRQVGIELAESDDPMTGTQQIRIDGQTATRFDLQGAEKSIFGIMFAMDGKLWVLLLRGSNAIVKQEKERFLKFCESVKIEVE